MEGPEGLIRLLNAFESHPKKKSLGVIGIQEHNLKASDFQPLTERLKLKGYTLLITEGRADADDANNRRGGVLMALKDSLVT